MSCCQKIKNSLCSLKRCKRFFQNSEYIPISNCSESYISNKVNKITSLATWNIQGLFFYMSSEKHTRLLYELSLLNQDVICLQEVFECKLKQDIIKTMSNTHPYYLLGNTHKRYIIGEDSGLLVLSKYPIQFKKEIILEDAVLPDSLSNKSILYFSVGNLNLVNTHLQSPNVNSAEHIATKQTKQIGAESPFDEYIIMGDLNNIQAFRDLDCIPNNTSTTWNQSILDYIIPMGYTNLTLQTNVSDRDIKGITDHNCLFGKIDYIN